ncbi:transmembrane protein, putative (macronuclear) [Tetrahymena thermophila SB210]|uniref:Transmembrane protein, putative n=1 Tax=Tetrahymena thermophila (strain SB210) TaxID=312017 RepID=W7XHM8_TETTS|nr:transmembrane protein, putative [Tetrahymena thermophila SB210]EWS73916.1 transmembrane protein, putative [Tetrahymena thermophila SB210]|eukprot:XP_012653538.1 transmembrane protein, putative [Tetrahymena thermophila SB210]
MFSICHFIISNYHYDKTHIYFVVHFPCFQFIFDLLNCLFKFVNIDCFRLQGLINLLIIEFAHFHLFYLFNYFKVKANNLFPSNFNQFQRQINIYFSLIMNFLYFHKNLSNHKPFFNFKYFKATIKSSCYIALFLFQLLKYFKLYQCVSKIKLYLHFNLTTFNFICQFSFIPLMVSMYLHQKHLSGYQYCQ